MKRPTTLFALGCHHFLASRERKRPEDSGRLRSRLARGFALLLLGGLWPLPTRTRAAEPAKEQPSAAEIKKLVGQLAGADKGRAARAGNRLVKLGPAALAALRDAIARNPKGRLGKAAGDMVGRIARKAEQALRDQLAKLKARRAVVRRLTADSLARNFPAHLVFSVRFPLYPTAVRPPAPLKSRNLFFVDAAGEPEQVINFKELEAFFRANVGAARNKQRAQDAARAWLWMTQELSQDGFLQFSIPPGAVKVGPELTSLKAVGRATVKPEKGNKGYIEVTITFDMTGMLEDVKEKKEITTGKRPKKSRP
jgi:hypothetical protein